MSMDIHTLRTKLAHQTGKSYWRSLNEAAESPEFKALLEAEFPMHAALWAEDFDRRRFLQLSGATLALAGLVGCGRQPLEHIVPYVEQPEDIVPGKPLYFATAIPHGGYAHGVLVETHMGRPTKIEGNPSHPASLGATNAHTQAAILDFYDPDRSQVVTHLGRILTWSSFQTAAATIMRTLGERRGEGLRILTEQSTSPTVAEQMDRCRRALPLARWHQYEAAGAANTWQGAELAFGRPYDTYYDLAKADVILTLDCDLLGDGPGHVAYARQFADRRRLVGRANGTGGHATTGRPAATPHMNRLYAVEATPTQTGAIADHRLPLPPAAIWDALAHMARGSASGELPETLRLAVDDLNARRGRSLVAAGPQAPPEAHALVHSLNAQLGNVGQTVFYTEPLGRAETAGSLSELAEAMHAGQVDTLIVMGANPVYSAPGDLAFAQAMEKVGIRIHLGAYADETAALCHWHLPASHPLETWGDARAFDGTATLMQPTIAPLYDGRSPAEFLALLLTPEGAAPQSGHALVRTTWQQLDDASWRQALHDGVVPATRTPTLRPTVRQSEVRQVAATLATKAKTLPPAAGTTPDVTLLLRPDPSVGDGRYANNGWLQELPKPWTRLTWDNALLVGPALAESLGVKDEDVVAVTAGAQRLEAPIWILPGQAPGTATLHLGYGRRTGGQVLAGTGTDAYPLLDSARGFSRAARIEPTGRHHELACTQDHFLMAGRDMVRSATVAEYTHHPDFAHAHGHHGDEDLSMFPPHDYPGHAWGVTIDTGACIGCNACVVACNAENNVPVVGKDQVRKAREMHWLRIDRYFEGELDDPTIAHQPVMCMHCENAPCEQVCPVAATTHSAEGLNDMVYNRCVGTRYCSNNCPYKVRRFNFLQYEDYDAASLKLMRNPDVSVRHRGVMEKCSYCVQRINQARIAAKRDGRPMADGDVQTACQQACPTQAIVFGDTNNPAAKVSQLKASPLNYTLFDELNVKPRTSYLATVRNPHPDATES